jgi:hypothetical protein
MKTSNRMMPLLLLLGLFAFSVLAYLSPVGQVMAEGDGRAIEASALQADAAQPRRCEDREVEADEGYGVSHKEIRRVCQ